jgi:hypothetical protein
MSITNIKRDDTYIMYYEMLITSEDGKINLVNDFASFDWDDLNSDLIEWVDIGYKARDNIERMFKTGFDNYIRVEKAGINLLKGRNHFTAPSVLIIDHKPIPVNLEFKRLKEKSAF